jgi:Tol biopolymer transport system component
VQGDVLMYGRPAAGRRVLRWVDRGGTAAGTLGDPMPAWDVRLAPSGTRVAVATVDPQLNTLDIFVYDGDRPLPRRVSPAIDADETPVWSRDGSMLAWTSGRRTLTKRSALVDRPDEPVRKMEHPVRVTDWSPDGRWLVVSESRPGTRADLWLVPAETGEPRAYAQSPFNEIHGVVSPDGGWIAYASDESGRYEIYVDTFPAPGTRGRLSSGGGLEPRWSADGSELYFRRGSEVHAVRPALTGTPEATASERLFDARVDIRSYDVTPDGRRFLLNLPAEESERAVVSVVVNWRQLLPKPVE